MCVVLEQLKAIDTFSKNRSVTSANWSALSITKVLILAKCSSKLE